MKVKKLIKELKKVNQEAIVGTADCYGCCEEIEDVNECMFENTNNSPKDIILS